jgi:hypothetical protein
MEPQKKMESAVKLEDFQKSLWRRHLLKEFLPLCLRFFLFLPLVMAADWYFRLTFSWRVFFLLIIVFLVVHFLFRILKQNAKPREEEIYVLACESQGLRSFDAIPEDLELGEDLFQPLPWSRIFLLLFFLCLSFAFPQGRLGLKRLFLLSGQWPKKTHIVDLTFPEHVEQGFPVLIEFSLKGLLPKRVRFSVDGQVKTLMGRGAGPWRYDFYHSPGKLHLRLEAGDDSRDFEVQVHERAGLFDLKARVEAPAYLGGRTRVSEGLNVFFPEGSRVTLLGQAENVMEWENPSHFRQTARGLEWPLGVLTGDRTLSLKGRSHEAFPFRELALFQLFCQKDRVPEVSFSGKKKILNLFPGALLDLAYQASDDHGLEKVELFQEGVLIKSDEASSLKKEGHMQIRLNKEAGERVRFSLIAYDNRFQKSAKATLVVNVMDRDIYKARVIEDYRGVRQSVEKLIASLERRASRERKKDLLDAAAERNTLREDLKLTNRIQNQLKKLVKNMKQLDDLQTLKAQTRQDEAFFEDILKPHLSRKLSSSEKIDSSTRDMISPLKEMSRRMARLHNVYAVLRLIDQMIDKEKKVIQAIP